MIKNASEERAETIDCCGVDADTRSLLSPLPVGAHAAPPRATIKVRFEPQRDVRWHALANELAERDGGG